MYRCIHIHNMNKCAFAYMYIYICVDIDLNLCTHIQICCEYIANVRSCQSIFRSLSPLLINVYA